MGIYSIALEIFCHWNWNVGIISYFIIRIIRRRVNAEQNKNQIQYESRHQESMVMENDIKSTLPWQCYVRIWFFSWSNFLLYTRRDFFSFRIGDRIFFSAFFMKYDTMLFISLSWQEIAFVGSHFKVFLFDSSGSKRRRTKNSQNSTRLLWCRLVEMAAACRFQIEHIIDISIVNLICTILGMTSHEFYI